MSSYKAKGLMSLPNIWTLPHFQSVPRLVSNPWHRTREWDYGLWPCKPVYPLPLHRSAPPWTWNSSYRRHSGLVVWVVYLVKITFKTGCRILFRRISRRRQRVSCWPCVLHFCCWQSIHILFRDSDLVFWYQEASPKYWNLFCKYDVSWLYYFQHCCLGNNVV